MNIYIPTSNKYIHLVEALLYSLKKYWYDFDNTKVVIVGYKEPKYALPKNVLFKSIGDEDEVKNWAIDLKNYFDTVDDELFVYMNDDAALVYDLDIDLFNYLIEIAEKNDNVGRISLTKDVSNNPHEIIKEEEDFSVVELSQTSSYRLSTQFSIWNKEYLTKYMTENMTPWEFELQSTPKNDGWRIIGIKDRYCLDFYHLWRRGAISKSWSQAVHSGVNLPEDSEYYDFISKVIEND